MEGWHEDVVTGSGGGIGIYCGVEGGGGVMSLESVLEALSERRRRVGEGEEEVVEKEVVLRQMGILERMLEWLIGLGRRGEW